ncbi:MAG: SDR family oxidoreductase [Dehalococcoidia bacterium]|nr:SDR family oxidoreductase [Dehalococcoidia bacterium]
MANSMFDLSGRHALVTGATGPLGRALAVALAEAGANVSVTTLGHDRAQEVEANSILNECWSAGSKGAAKTVDLTSPSEVQAAVADLEREFGPIDILVNAAHGANIKPVLESSLADWMTELNRNATSVFVACHAVGKGMVERGRGRIINLVSLLHDRGVPNCALFGASQGAVLGFSKSLAIEWGRGEPLVEDRVTVNTVIIGFLEDVPGPQNDPAVREVLERYIPLRRLGNPKDLQGAVVYLASDRTNFVNGETLAVDGAIIHHA